MLLHEAKHKAMTAGRPCMVVQVGEAYDNYQKGEYYVRGFIAGQYAYPGMILNTQGSITNFYDTVIEVYPRNLIKHYPAYTGSDHETL